MSSKRKLIILMLVLSFVLLSIIATVAVLFALTQQTIKTSLNMVYNVEDVDGEVRASYTIGETTTYLTPKADANHIGDDGNSLIFKAEDVENAGTLEFPTEKLNLTSENSIIVIQYTYKNNGGKTFAATMNPILTVNDNMNIRYGIYDEVTGTIKYSTQTYALIVPENGTLSYWIEISIKDLSRNANLEGSFEWDVLGVDKDTLGYESLTLVDFVTDEGCDVTTLKVNVKPNVTSWRGIRVSTLDLNTWFKVFYNDANSFLA